MGKTTMTNMLTGKDLKTSGGAKGCTTTHQKAEGNGWEVHDTPGDDDQNITKEAWKKLVTGAMEGVKFDVLVFLLRFGERPTSRDAITTLMSGVFQDFGSSPKIDPRRWFFVYSRPT